MSDFQSVFKRKEVKYLLSREQYEAFLPALLEIAEIDRYGESDILSMYFDTPNYRLIRTSLEKPVYKEKFRLRTYGVPTSDTPAFAEIKKKYDGIVYKRRISLPYPDALKLLTDRRTGTDHRTDCSSISGLSGADRQIAGEIDAFFNCYEKLSPAMVISCKRIALAGKEDPDFRVTFDRDIHWRTDNLDLRAGTGGKDLLKDGQRLMEIKVKDSISLSLSRKMSELRIFPVSFSKYGAGYQEMQMETLRTRFAGQLIRSTAGNTPLQHKGGVAYA